MRLMIAIVLIGLGAGTVGATHPDDPLSRRAARLREEKIQTPYDSLKRVAVPKKPPLPGDWLSVHDEMGQSYARYVLHSPRRSVDSNAFDIQPLGEFTPTQKHILQASVQYLRRYFSLPVRMMSKLPLNTVPEEMRRIHPVLRVEQLFTPWILRSLLKPRRPADTLGLIAFTTVDLYPGEEWNYVFGQASLDARVGVWSMNRYGNPEVEYERVLTRTIKTAVHELSHMLGMEHCIAYECVMNGSNNLEEADRAPVEPCPICLQKLCWKLGCDPVRRSRELLEFTAKEHLQHIRHELMKRDEVLRTLARR